MLDPGDILVFHSDGLSEAPDPEGQFFGTERLASLLEAERRASARRNRRPLARGSAEFTHGAPDQDDRTLVVMKVR